MNWALHFCFWNLDTIEGAAYEKVYDLLCGECSERFGFFQHERAYYAQPELYDRLLRMRGHTCVEYLLLENQRLAEETRQKQEMLAELEKENRAVKNSATFRAGRVITAVPGKIKKVLKGNERLS